MVKGGSTNISTIENGQLSKAKYPILVKKYNFNIDCWKNVCYTCCQICCDRFLHQTVLILTKTNASLHKTNSNEISQITKYKLLTANNGLVLLTTIRIYKYKIKIRFNTYLLSKRFIPLIVNQSTLLVSKLFQLSLLLRSGDVEPNPGPQTQTQTQTQTLSLHTYNARGLKNRLKLKRILNSCHKLINKNKNAIIFLQETHLEISDKKVVELMWRYKFLLSPGTNRQCGCLTLFDPSWEVIDHKIDNEGRVGLVVLGKFDRNFVFANVYAPNDHNITFFSNIFNTLIETQNMYPGAEIVLAGDFNLVLSEDDAINRTTSNTESQSRTLIKNNLSRLNLKDSFRQVQQTGGFTWFRGDCMSRLDMIFVSAGLCSELLESKTDWSFDDSDHALLETTIRVRTTFEKGPGLFRIDADVLDDEVWRQKVVDDLNFQIEQIPNNWNPHTRLDFVKTAVRSIISVITGSKRKIDNFDKKAVSEQLNTLMKVKEKLEGGELNNPTLLTDVNSTIRSLEAENKRFLDEHSKKLSIRAQVKWYEEGERSNKYFLNLIKKRSEQKLITKLATDDGVLETQTEIMNHVTEFYSNLYDNRETSDNFDDLLSDLPTLNDEDRRLMDLPITLDELRQVVNECGDSAPGPDGIPYKVYRNLWSQLGPFLLEAWKYSTNIKILPLDQRVSAITLLPKQGKSPDRIENWRPITLTNCDLKIFTKLLSNRVSKVLDKLIHPSQTAYIPGRVVHDNLRLFDFYNNYCKEKDIDALLISLDAKKAFDSVSHKYLHKVLASYGFSDDFIETVKLLYKDIKANILVNGYKSVMIKILRSVKQGDALSCALFILCIDPLIRKIENNPAIKPVDVSRSRFTGIKISNKIAGFADDIGAAVNNDNVSINNVFSDYALFSSLSGIELNLDKTEILKLNVNSLHRDFVSFPVRINGTVINTVESVKICGICFSNNANIAYDSNVIDKIVKMERQLIMWLQRPLSMEGKILIVKTFGLSQLIYSLQMCNINERELIDVERMIFKFLWNKRWVGSAAPDRIKRLTLKLPYEKGGLQAPDIAFLDKALKVKQFLRAMKTSHPINLVQKFQMERIGYDEYYKCEYAKICKTDSVIAVFQHSCNYLTDQFRNRCSFMPIPDPDQLRDVINIIASTDVLEYLMRKRELMLINRYGQLANIGIINFKQLLNESIFPSNDITGNLAKYVLDFLPSAWKTAVLSIEDINTDITYEHEFPSINLQVISHDQVTVKSIRKTLIEFLDTPPHPYTNFQKFQLLNVNNGNPFTIIRKSIHMPRDKFFKYRILQGDVFCNERLFRFKLAISPNCDFCSNITEVETIKHTLWDCPRSQRVWNLLKQLVTPAYGVDYFNYETVILGAANYIPLVESLILLGLKLILVKDRTAIISNEEIISRIKMQFIIEKVAMRNSVRAFNKRWSKLETILFRHDN